MSGCREGSGKNKAGPSSRSVGNQELTASLELSACDWDIRFGLRHTAGASFPELGHKEVRAHAT